MDKTFGFRQGLRRVLQFLLKILRDFPGARRTASNRRFEPMRPAEGGIDLPMANQPQIVMKRLFAPVVFAALRSLRKNRVLGRAKLALRNEVGEASPSKPPLRACALR
ncbi:MAG: hypothetical protein IKR85_02975 [Clostridia bacterium]|nr:hypothetical protein [Clostridia bacterium]